MAQQPALSPDGVLRNYFNAKDGNRPHLLDSVFTSDASLVVRNASSNIAFPAATQGREAIAEVLVRQFNQTYENIYSFYLAHPPATAQFFSCAWLVGMTEKESRSVRVGCGTYDWTFSPKPPNLATVLAININAMVILPPSSADVVLPWLLKLTYPWSSPVQVSHSAPSLRELEPVLEHLAAQ